MIFGIYTSPTNYFLECSSFSIEVSSCKYSIQVYLTYVQFVLLLQRSFAPKLILLRCLRTQLPEFIPRLTLRELEDSSSSYSNSNATLSSSLLHLKYWFLSSFDIIVALDTIQYASSMMWLMSQDLLSSFGLFWASADTVFHAHNATQCRC